MATPDDCSPRNMTVRLPLNYTDTQVVYYPECTMVQRCGGCCPVQFLTCEPLYKEQMVYNVSVAKNNVYFCTSHVAYKNIIYSLRREKVHSQILCSPVLPLQTSVSASAFCNSVIRIYIYISSSCSCKNYYLGF